MNLAPRQYEGPVRVIANPVAGRGGAATVLRGLVHRSRRHVSAVVTERAGHARELALAAIEQGIGRLIAVGGDGTVHEVADAIVASGQPVELGIIATGTGIDVVRNLGLPPTPGIGHLLVETRLRRFDVLACRLEAHGQLRLEHVVNAIDCGIGAVVAEAVNRSGQRDRAAFLRASLQAIRHHQAVPMQVRVDDTLLADGLLDIVVAANGGWFGGGMHVAPEAQPDDGLLEGLALHATPRLLLAADVLPRLYRGAHLGHANLRRRAGRSMSVELDTVRLWELDGEIRLAERASVTVLAAALRVVVPAG